MMNLFHGSPIPNIEIFLPKPARGVGEEKDKLVAVYATHERNVAIPFAFTFQRDANGELSWQLDFPDHLEHPQIVLKAGTLDLKRQGYIYRLPPDTFEKIDEFQWVSYKPVKPVAVSVIDLNQYCHWIQV